MSIMSRQALDRMSLEELKGEAVRLRLRVSDNRELLINDIMDHMEQHSPMRDMLLRNRALSSSAQAGLSSLQGDLTANAGQNPIRENSPPRSNQTVTRGEVSVNAETAQARESLPPPVISR